MNNNEFKDGLRLAKQIGCKELVLNFTTLDDYFRSPRIPDNQKVLMALLVLSRRFKKLPIYNTTIAEYLNNKGMYKTLYKNVSYMDERTGEYVSKYEEDGYTLVFSKTVIREGKEIKEPLYTKSGVSDAIKKWEREGILKITYEYEFNKAMDKPYKYITERQISFDFDKLKALLACCSFDDELYKSLPERSRKRKLIRQKPLTCLDELKEIFNELSEELKVKYQTARGIFLAWCWKVSRKYYNVKLTTKPTATETDIERNIRLSKRVLKKQDETYMDSIKPEHLGDPIIKAVFKKMVGNN